MRSSNTFHNVPKLLVHLLIFSTFCVFSLGNYYGLGGSDDMNVDWIVDHDDALHNFIEITSEVKDALQQGKPVVALESTVISHGMPYPQNFDTGLAIERIVREGGAIPATIALLNGKIHVGLSEEEMKQLAIAGHSAIKTSRRDIAYVLASKKVGATTVAGTSLVASMVGISVFVTGGIGGVHRHGELTMDISADLRELGKTPVAVVCAGAKSILDIGRTLEYLETEGVPVIGYNTDEFPAFFTPKSGFPVSSRLNTSEQVARLIHFSHQLNLGGIVIGVPIREEDAGDAEVLEAATQQALKEADDKHILGKEVTPFLLQRIQELTGGASLKANIALIKNNARVGTSIAVELARLRKPNIGFLQDTNANAAVIIGGAVIDMIARSDNKLISSTSNPGKIVYRYGGVSRNVAEIIARLGISSLLMSAVGNDMQADVLLTYCNQVGISTRGLYRSTKYGTAIYNAILDSNGEMQVAIADMDVFSEITPHYVSTLLNQLHQAKLVYIDMNVPKETVQYVAENHGNNMLWIEPTSVPKSIKVADPHVLKHIDYISPNRYEIAAIAKNLKPTIDSSKTDLDSCKEYIKVLLDAGVKHVVLKVGADGVIVGAKHSFAQDASSVEGYYFKHYLPLEPETIVSVTGAGDSLAGATIFSLLQNKSLDDSIKFGLLGAKLSLESDYSVSPLITPATWNTFKS